MSNVVTTGASRGIGLAMAIELARAGHSVIATMRNPEGSPELSERVASEKPPVRIETMDVDSDERTGWLVNNAGIKRMGAIEETWI